MKSEGTLYLVATPIGNLGDITFRAIEILKQVDFIASEDTRQTQKLLARYEIKTPRLSYHDHSPQAKLRKLIAILKEGKNVALVADSGTPLISDPGYPLVREAIKEGIRVESIPGPTALATALILSGLPSEKFYFHGYLSRKRGRRRQELTRLAEIENSLIFYESPHRLEQTLTDLKEILGDREAALCRELTKKFEEVLRGRISELIEQIKTRKKLGELVLVVSGK